MIGFLFLTALTVSIDSFVCGFSLAMGTKKKIPIVLGITLVVFLLCLCTNYLALFLAEKMSEKTVALGGLILMAIGFFNLFNRKKEKEKKSGHGLLKQSLILGFGVGLDGAFANLSLSLMGLNAFYVPVIITAMHAVMISSGILLSQTKIVKKLAKIEFIPPLILILLGGYKTLGLFI